MKQRIISAVLLIIICIPILLIGGNPFVIFAGIIGCLAFRELVLLREKDDYKLPFFVKVLSYLSLLYIIFNNYESNVLYLNLDYRLISLLIFVFLIPPILIANDKKYSFLDGLYLMGCVFLIGFSFNMLILIRNYSLNIVIYLFLITILTDTFALITGRLIGKHKLCSAISPNKTVEGLIGGSIMGTIIASIFYTTIITTNATPLTVVLITLSLTIIGQFGDLVFSSIKRHYKIKDFSNLIPGHGGVLDRMDSIIFVILMYIFFIGTI